VCGGVDDHVGAQRTHGFGQRSGLTEVGVKVGAVEVEGGQCTERRK